LHEAAQQGHTAPIELLLGKGADIDPLDETSLTPLIAAAAAGHTNAVKLLLDKGANIHHKDVNGFSALHKASANGKTDTVSVLVKRGANPDDKSASHESVTPLILATRGQHLATMTELLTLKALPNLSDYEKVSPLHVASDDGFEEGVKLLIENGNANVNSRTIRLVTPLLLASAGGYETIVEVRQIFKNFFQIFPYSLLLSYLIIIVFA